MAERWAERSIADLVLRAWCPFLVNRGPCRNWIQHQPGEYPQRRPIGKPSRASESGRSGIESIPNPKGCHLLGEVLLKQQLDARRVLRVSLLRPGIFAICPACRGLVPMETLNLTLAGRSDASWKICAGLSLVTRETGGHSWRNGHPFLLANPCVVFVAIDATRFLVLLCVNNLAILFRQVPVILRTHTALFPVDSGFLVFQT
jgi:hypothetical protein